MVKFLYMMIAVCAVFRAEIATVLADFSQANMCRLVGHCTVFFIFGWTLRGIDFQWKRFFEEPLQYIRLLFVNYASDLCLHASAWMLCLYELFMFMFKIGPIL